MVKWLVNKYTKDQDFVAGRATAGRISGMIGILLNIFLFGIKFGIGTIVHSISIRADGINNLTDAGSSILSVISFHFANKPADKEHPYGHQRTEVITSFVIAVFLCVLGLKMMQESIEKIQSPDPIDFRLITIVILVISILVKGYMYYYNTVLSKDYKSTLLKAVAMDAISDIFGTIAVLVSTCISPLLHINLDGYMGVIVSVLIMYNAYEMIKDTMSDLIGKAPDPEQVKDIELILIRDKQVKSVHDVLIHNYGPGEVFASAHVVVDADEDMLVVHDAIDHLEREVKKQLGIDLVIHMDPIRMHDPVSDHYQSELDQALHDLNSDWTYHDFRVMHQKNHICLEFDLVVPYEEHRSEQELIDLIRKHMPNTENLCININIDHPICGA